MLRARVIIHTSFKMPQEVHHALQELAEQLNMTMSEVLFRLIMQEWTAQKRLRKVS